jgi:hypothetical protein
MKKGSGLTLNRRPAPSKGSNAVSVRSRRLSVNILSTNFR